ncbi:splicing factor, Prp19-binding domain-containing protein [Thamnocephalis sphaerospora]|uniref:Splicing factor, Prp19-binding domain-containing protein n=1 Tax=Thamnocephalis sphaerospora TaxID=78915 RepID=A0A4V1IWP4_9FUNG|nr:splicing factor, Prp19-binding domain-containing protein [Thamnocephalis sphaerospora]|eukprot:RKP08269.1 splicing factor, Prp19-binding domain-containing protein [Thamnocephalis sphaerospora]
MSARSASQPKRERVKVTRYWPGRAPTEQPDPLADSDSDSDESEASQAEEDVDVPLARTRAPVGGIRMEVHSLKTAEFGGESQIDSERARLVRERRARQGEAAMAEGKEEEGEESEDDETRRRQLLRQRLLQRRREEEAELAAGEEEEKESGDEMAEGKPGSGQATVITAVDEGQESEYTTEYETDSEESEEEVLLKPVFVPKSGRVTVAEKEHAARELQEAEEKREAERIARKEAAHKMVADIIKQEIENTEADKMLSLGDILAVDDTDGLDPTAEQEAWKLRELKRIRRDREEREKMEMEQKDIERRRAMTDAEIMREDAEKLQADRDKKKGSQFKFMQKYYHKGAFYADEDILKRDYTAPTQDMPNVEMLPSVMQVRDFGKRSQTKWTHLAAEDTTERNAAWSQNSDINKRMAKRMGGIKGSVDKPTAKRRRN